MNEALVKVLSVSLKNEMLFHFENADSAILPAPHDGPYLLQVIRGSKVVGMFLLDEVIGTYENTVDPDKSIVL